LKHPEHKTSIKEEKMSPIKLNRFMQSIDGHINRMMSEADPRTESKADRAGSL